MPTLRRAAARDVVLLTIGGLALVMAVFVFVMFGGGDEGAPTDESSWTHYVCEGCGEFFHLDGAEMDRIWSDPNQIGTSGDGRTMTFRCKKCGELKAVRAEKCPQHGEIIKLSPGEDDAKQCSQCKFRG